jgi:hypothetical protein
VVDTIIQMALEDTQPIAVLASDYIFSYWHEQYNNEEPNEK